MNPKDFKIFIPLLKTSKDADGRMRFHGTASSTIKDRHGDTITLTALGEMERSAAENMTIFLNHEYKVPEDVAGSVERAIIAKTADPNVHDLQLDIVVNSANERAVKAWEAIDGGTKLGLSIGARIPDGGATRDKESGRYKIDHIDLLETSIVGVPANPRSWIEYAVKALNGNPVVDETTYTTNADGSVTRHTKVGIEVEIDLEKESHAELPDSAFACIDSKGRHYPHHTASGAVNKALLRNALARLGDPSNTHCGAAHVRAHAKKLGIGSGSATDEKAQSFEELLTFAVGDDYGVEHFENEEVFEGDEADVLAADAAVELAKAKKPAGHTHPHAHVHDHEHDHWNGITHSHEHAHTHAHEHDDAHEHVDDMQGSEHDHGHQDSYGDNDHPHEEDARKEGSPTLTGDELAAHLAEFAITSHAPEGGNGAASAPQEAPSSGPENGGAPAATTELDIQPTVTASILAANETLKALTRELDAERELRKAAVQERDQAVSLAEKALSDTASLLKRIASTPVGRKAVVTEMVSNLESLKSVYGEAFVDLLTKKDKP